MALSVLVSAWLVGSLGGLHCMSMCGGFVAAIAARDRGGGGASLLLPRKAIVRQQIGYHAGRILTYTLLGTAFGAGGSALLRATDVLTLQRSMFVFANVLLLVLGVRLALNTQGDGWLQRAGARIFKAVLPVVRPLLQQSGMRGRMALGLLWGLVPCALIYSVLPLAMFAGGPWQGAMVMLAFGLGTLPNLVAAGLFFQRTRFLVERTTLRFAAGALVSAFAIAGIYRVFYVPNALAAGPFCWVP
jgi:sulfite exporter TauE/SafE